MDLFYIDVEDLINNHFYKENSAVDFIAEIENEDLIKGSFKIDDRELIFFTKDDLEDIQNKASIFLGKNIKYKSCNLIITLGKESLCQQK